jgi:AmmeMemoRadiSam system protein B
LNPRILEPFVKWSVNAMNRRERTLPRGWYPFDGKDCRREIESYLEGWTPPQLPWSKGRGGIIPHAGWYFSGKLATRVLYSLASKNTVEVVVLYGGHLSTGDVPRIVTEEACETPLGDIEIHAGFVKSLMKSVDMRKESPASGDNTIEIQLAMVKYFFPEAKLVAIRSPLSLKAELLGNEVAEIAKKESISILAIGSTDLTHYGPNYGFLSKGVGRASVDWVKKENDKGFIDRALRMDAEGLLKHALENDSACSAGAAISAMATCKALGSEKGILLDHYTSYDIMPDDSFVGYAGILY